MQTQAYEINTTTENVHRHINIGNQSIKYPNKIYNNKYYMYFCKLSITLLH